MSAVVEKTSRVPVWIIIPTYNAAPYIEKTIRSVMAQTYDEWHLLVLDDGSSDDTVERVRRLAEEDTRITLSVNEQNVGVARTRNRGMDLCGEGYVAFLDSDDCWHPEKLECQVRLAEETGADILYSSYAIIDNNGNPCRRNYIVPQEADFNLLLRENVIGCSATMLSPRAAQTYRFPLGFYHEDYCLWLQMLRDGCRAAGCTQVLTMWRLANGSRSFDKRNGARQRWRIYREYLRLPLGKSMVSFIGYAFNGIKKYARNEKND